jgi:hypothetical protein
LGVLGSRLSTNSYATSTATELTVTTNSSVINGVFIKCLVRNGATAGTVTFQWAQNAANAAATIVKAGSFLASDRLQ